MKCPNCGTIIPDTAKFCGNCGKSMKGEKENEFANPLNQSAESNPGIPSGYTKCKLCGNIFLNSFTTCPQCNFYNDDYKFPNANKQSNSSEHYAQTATTPGKAAVPASSEYIRCDNCGTLYQSRFNTCPQCNLQNSKHNTTFSKERNKTIIVAIITALVLIIGFVSLIKGNDSTGGAVSSLKATIGERNALRKGKDYLSVMAFSYQGLINQLKFDGFSQTEAVYAADHCGANWKKQAAKKAEEYLDVMPFSRSGLISQLEFEGFTHEEALYGVEQVGY